MLNYIWAFMIIIGIIYGSLTGHMAELSNAALDSAKEAVTLCITMLGVMALWVGLMQIAQKAGTAGKEDGKDETDRRNRSRTAWCCNCNGSSFIRYGM